MTYTENNVSLTKIRVKHIISRVKASALKQLQQAVINHFGIIFCR